MSSPANMFYKTREVPDAAIKEYPTPWQRKVMWAALTALFVVVLIVIIGTVIWTSANIISFLQPILIPVAIAVILTYLLDPLVTKMSRGTLSRTKAVAKGDRTCDRNNRSKPAKADDCRTPTHSSLRRKTNAQPAAGASHSGGKVFGNFKEKHWRISWRNRFFAQSHPGADLSIFPA